MADRKQNLMFKTGTLILNLSTIVISGLNHNHKARGAKLERNALIKPQPSISSKPDRG